MKTDRQTLGQQGEELAADYLRKKGYKILKTNFRYRHTELDIICREKDTLVIVEVKSVRVPAFGSGEERLSPQKQRNIIKTTYAFLRYRSDLIGLGVRFDVIAVNFENVPADIVHYEGAFCEGY
jgi:putative endonuclease